MRIVQYIAIAANLTLFTAGSALVEKGFLRSSPIATPSGAKPDEPLGPGIRTAMGDLLNVKSRVTFKVSIDYNGIGAWLDRQSEELKEAFKLWLRNLSSPVALLVLDRDFPAARSEEEKLSFFTELLDKELREVRGTKAARPSAAMPDRPLLPEGRTAIGDLLNIKSRVTFKVSIDYNGIGAWLDRQNEELKVAFKLWLRKLSSPSALLSLDRDFSGARSEEEKLSYFTELLDRELREVRETKA